MVDHFGIQGMEPLDVEHVLAGSLFQTMPHGTRETMNHQEPWGEPADIKIAKNLLLFVLPVFPDQAGWEIAP